MASLQSAFGDPTQDKDVDVYTVTTDGGSATLTYDEPFEESPTLIVSGPTGGAGWSAVGASQATITGTDGDEVSVVAIGDR